MKCQNLSGGSLQRSSSVSHSTWQTFLLLVLYCVICLTAEYIYYFFPRMLWAWFLVNVFLSLSSSIQKPIRYRRAISYDSKEYYMRVLSGNPGMYQHSIEQSSEGVTTQHEPEHGEDTIARVKGGRISGSKVIWIPVLAMSENVIPSQNIRVSKFHFLWCICASAACS